MTMLADLAARYVRIDLPHVDIQRSEDDLITGCLPVLFGKIAYLVIGTHFRQIEGRLFDTLMEAGWHLEIERPAILSISSGATAVVVDGIQGWRNPTLLPDEQRVSRIT
jgi:hypothetical protein